MKTTNSIRSLDRLAERFAAGRGTPVPCASSGAAAVAEVDCLLESLAFIDRFEKQELDPKQFAGPDHLRELALEAYRDAGRHMEAITTAALPAIRTLHRTGRLDAIT